MTRVKISVLIFFLFFVSQQLFSQCYIYKASGGTVKKLDQEKNVIWSAEIFEYNSYTSNKIFGSVTDKNNDILVGGRFTTPIDVDPGLDVVEINPGDRVNWFFLKLDENGKFKWVKTLSPNTYEPFKASIDNQDNYYIYGLFRTSIDFDPSVNEYIVSPEGDGINGYILKLDNNGLFEWVKQVNGSPYANVKALEFDKNQNMILAGSFLENVDLNSDENETYLLNSDAPLAAYVAKWDSDGNLIWANSYDGDKPTYPQNITIDEQNNIFIGGTHMGGLIDLDPGDREFLVEGNGKSDIYVQKLDADGDFLWAKSIGGVDHDNIIDIESDTEGNLYTSGSFFYTVNFDPQNEGSVYSVKRIGIHDKVIREFIQKYSPGGNVLWTRVFNKWENVGDFYLTLPDEETIIGTDIRIPNLGCFENIEYRNLIIDDLDNMKSSNSISLSEAYIENSEQLHIMSKEVTLEKNVHIDKNSNVLIEGKSGCD